MKTQLIRIKNICLFLAGATVFSANAATYTATTNGNWSDPATWGGTAPGTTIILDQIIIPAGLTVTLDVDVAFNGLLASLNVDGDLTSTGNDLTFSQGLLTGSGTIDVSYLSFEGLSTMTFDGDITAQQLETSSINLGVAGMVTISDSLVLESGTITLNTGGNLTLNGASYVVVDNGSLTINGGLFTGSNAYNVSYIGTSKNTGVEAFGTGLNDIHITLDDSSETVTMTTDVHANGALNLSTGILSLNGNDLTISGNFTTSGNGSLAGSPTSSLIIETMNAPASPIRFETGAESLEDLDINMTNTGSVEIESDLTISGLLMLHKGDLEMNSGSTLTMAAGSEIQLWDGEILLTSGNFDGALAYDVTYFGGSHSTNNIELSGAGLTDVELNLDTEMDSVRLLNDLIVDGELSLNSGTLMLNGSDVEVIGSFASAEQGWIGGNMNSDLTFSMALGTNDTLQFATGHEMLDDLTINIVSGDYVMLGSNLQVNDLNLTTGGIMIHDNDITVNNNGTVAGYDINDYVMIDGEGALRMNVVSSGPYITFPVGTEDGYSPARIQLTSGSDGIFEVNVKEDVYSEGTTGNDDSQSESVVDRTWSIVAGSTGDADLQLEWTATSEVNGFDRSNAYISRYSSDWDTQPTSGAVTTGSGTYQLTRSTGMISGIYAVVDEDATVSVEEEEIVSFDVYPNPVQEVLTCVINIEEPVKLEVIDVAGNVVNVHALQYASFPLQYTLDFSGLPAGVYFVRISTNERQVNHKVIKS